MSPPESAKALTAAMRRDLAARGNRVRATIVIGRQGVSDDVVAQLRRMFECIDLIKARVEVDRGAEADAVAKDLARRVPCHLVQRIGKVVLLYQPPHEETEDPSEKKR